jgi:eight-cysteine-cluster-containing protein
MKTFTILAGFLAMILLFFAVACTNSSKDGIIPTVPENTTAECFVDADCKSAGCSGQVCTTNEKATDLITTCEYKEEYGCYKLTSCSCNMGKCGWKENDELKSCIEKANKNPSLGPQ